MSMVINLVEDHNIYLCEGGPVYNGGVQPTPITYLTQWKIVGNSEVHTDEYLTSWKVSGNSVVDNNTILSCGDLGQDGKYHVKISNGVDIYDIALDEPLRKVNDIADTIEFPSDTEGKALVIRNLGSEDMGKYSYSMVSASTLYRGIASIPLPNVKLVDGYEVANMLCALYDTVTAIQSNKVQGVAVSGNGRIIIHDFDYVQQDSAEALKAHVNGVDIIYELATPTTELVDAPQIAVSPTDTYTSANATPYSAFEYTKHSEIWSCGEYNPIDGKYHILVQPLGGSIADIALTEPLRKFNDVADIIEFPSDTEGKALVIRSLMYDTLDDKRWNASQGAGVVSTSAFMKLAKKPTSSNITANIFINDEITYSYAELTTHQYKGCALSTSSIVCYYADGCMPQSGKTPTQIFYDAISGKHILFELATPITELVDAPQIEKADSYSMVISQGAKSVSWSDFIYDSDYLLTDSENNILVDSENYQLTVQS